MSGPTTASLQSTRSVTCYPEETARVAGKTKRRVERIVYFAGTTSTLFARTSRGPNLNTPQSILLATILILLLSAAALAQSSSSHPDSVQQQNATEPDLINADRPGIGRRQHSRRPKNISDRKRNSGGVSARR